MILISHRGNISGSCKSCENKPMYIDLAIEKGYDVEVDIWVTGGIFYLGHDEPQYEISLDWLDERKDVLWVHCKNIEAIETFNLFPEEYNYFWHQEDTVTLTSKNFIWAYPGKQPVNRSIAVMPELFNDSIDACLGVCSDYIQNYKQ
jgi:hypothetical protein